MKKKNQYAVDQHSLCCELLGVCELPTDPGPTLYEAVVELHERLKLGEPNVACTFMARAVVPSSVAKQFDTGHTTMNGVPITIFTSSHESLE